MVKSLSDSSGNRSSITGRRKVAEAVRCPAGKTNVKSGTAV